MLVEKSGVSFAEDALSSSYYTTASSSESTAICSTESFTSTTASISSTSSQKRGGFLTFLDWFKFGVSEEKKHDKDTVDEIIKSFVKNDVVGMEKFILPDISIHHPEDVDCVCCEEEEVQLTKVEKPAPKPKATPHVNKILSQLPPKVRKAVRFELDYTPEEKTDRPFTPLYTSTPNQKDEDVDSDEDDLPPLREVDSNTLVNPLNNTSSILLAHTSVMDSWNKSREDTDNAIRIATSNKNSYKIYYDDTDEEEVVDNPPVEDTPRRTFVVSSEVSSETNTLHEQSFDHELDTSTDSSVILGLDRIEDYIRALEDEIVTANRVKRERDVVRARGALRHAQMLQERIGLMQSVLAEMCASLEDTGADGDHSNLSAVLEDSCWSAQLGLEDGSFDGHQL